MSGLGRRPPSDWEHVEKYPIRTALPTPVQRVERALNIPPYKSRYDQGNEGACVGFSSSWMMSIQRKYFFDAEWLYKQAQLVDEYPSTPPDEGTSVRAGMDVLRDKGHVRILLPRGTKQEPNVAYGITANRWAHSVDDVRTSIAAGIPGVFGLNWYHAFDKPIRRNGEYWLPELGPDARVRGGHAICCYAASDRRQAVRLINSWGKNYPNVWVSYDLLTRLMIKEGGEYSIVTDR